MKESFKSFLQWPVWVKIALFVSLFWCFGWYIESYSERTFDKTLFLVSLLPVILYWGMAWIFHKTIKIFNIIFLSVFIFAVASFFGFIIGNDYLTKEAAKQQAADNYNREGCDKIIAAYVRPKDPPAQTNGKDLFARMEITPPTQADRDYDWCVEQKKKARNQ